MKYKLLATCVAVAVLSGCGGSDDSDTSIQAYDGAIWGISGSFSCANGQTGNIPETGSTGYATIDNATVELFPETCTFTFDQTDADTVDVSNGKSMQGLSLSIPKGLAQAGSTPRATPFTTLIAKLVESDSTYNGSYSEAAARSVLTSLGLDELENSGGVTIAEILSNPETAIATVKQNSPTLAAKLVATTHIISDVLVKVQESGSTISTLSVSEIAQAAKNLATITVSAYPNYPQSSDSSDEEIYVDYKTYDLASVTEEDLSDEDVETIAEEVKTSDVYKKTAEPVTDDSDDSDDDSTGSSNDSTGANGGTGGV